MANDLKIMASSDISGGEYGNIKVMGTATIKDDIKCEELKVMGAVISEGIIDCGYLKVMGTAVLGDNVTCQNFDLLGTIECNYEANINVEGKFSVKGTIGSVKKTKAHTIDIKGIFSNDDCDVEEAKINGKIDIKNTLNCENIIIESSKLTSKINELVGANIEIKRKINLFGTSSNVIADINTIEGDQIKLEYTKVNVVRGKNIKIGRGCTIGSIEYTGSCQVNSNSKVENQVKL